MKINEWVGVLLLVVLVAFALMLMTIRELVEEVRVLEESAALTHQAVQGTLRGGCHD